MMNDAALSLKMPSNDLKYYLRRIELQVQHDENLLNPILRCLILDNVYK